MAIINNSEKDYQDRTIETSLKLCQFKQLLNDNYFRFNRGVPIMQSEIEAIKEQCHVGDYWICKESEFQYHPYFVGIMLTKSSHVITLQSLICPAIKKSLSYSDIIRLQCAGYAGTVSEGEALLFAKHLKRSS